jgi:FkbM family methyltransferase
MDQFNQTSTEVAGGNTKRADPAKLPDKELRMLSGLTRRFPRVRGFGRLSHLIQRFYRRKPRPRVQIDVLGFQMDLDPMESLDGYLVFAPQIYDYREFKLMGKLLRPGHTFLDAGANIGIYSLMASRMVGPQGKVIAVEAGSFNADCLRNNCELNRIKNVQCVQVGLSDKHEELTLACSDYGNRSGNSFIGTSSITEVVTCRPLHDLLESLQIGKVDGVKIDIEGFEWKVLMPYFAATPREDRPEFFIFEYNKNYTSDYGGDVRELFSANGYKVTPVWDQNYLAQLPESARKP